MAAIASEIFGLSPIFHQLSHVMNKKFLILGAALDAALAGTIATLPIPKKLAEVTLKTGEFDRTFASKQASAKLTSVRAKGNCTPSATGFRRLYWLH